MTLQPGIGSTPDDNAHHHPEHPLIPLPPDNAHTHGIPLDELLASGHLTASPRSECAAGRHRRSRDRTTWLCLAERVLGDWGPTLRLGLLLVLLVAGGITATTLLARWIPEVGLSVGAVAMTAALMVGAKLNPRTQPTGL